MKRRNFLRAGTITAMGGALSLHNQLNANAKSANQISERTDYAELNQHKIENYELIEIDFRWPRFVGKNGRIDFHGQHHKSTVIKLYTDQGATGWGLSGNKTKTPHTLLPAWGMWLPSKALLVCLTILIMAITL